MDTKYVKNNLSRCYRKLFEFYDANYIWFAVKQRNFNIWNIVEIKDSKMNIAATQFTLYESAVPKHEFCEITKIAKCTIQKKTNLNLHKVYVYDLPVYIISKFRISIFLDMLDEINTDTSVLEDISWIISNVFINMYLESTSQDHHVFLGNIAHKIRTPLNTIVNMNRKLLKTDMNVLQHDCVNLILNSSTDMITVINDVVDLTKLNMNTLKIKNERFRLETTIMKCMELISLEAKMKNINIELLIEDNTPQYIITDPVRCSQVIINLLSNAVKHTKLSNAIVNKIIIYVRSQLSEIIEESNSYMYHLEISVQDTGCGISNHDKKTLFNIDKNFLEHKKSSFSNGGIGLTVAKRIAKKLGGDLTLESTEVGKGSTFLFELSVLENDELNNSSLDCIKGRTIVIISNDNQKRLIIGSIFGKHGARITLYNNTNEAESLAFNGNNIYDLWIIDSDEYRDDFVEIVKTRYPLTKIIGLVLNSHIELKYVDKWIKWPNTTDLLSESAILIDSLNTKPELYLKQYAKDIKILLVDDTETNLIVLLGMLNEIGFSNIETRGDGQSALKYLNDQPFKFNILFIDIKMPNMSGIELIAELKKMYSDMNQQPPIMIGISAQPDFENQWDKIFDGFVQKPINRDNIRNVLDSVRAKQST